ncbi:MAG TPA: CopD family protein [Actinomycetota bacterium]|nr:CopD family protein [Actinomycetota bacterium]
MPRLRVLIPLAILMLAALAAPAYAHAIVESTEPSIDSVVETSPADVVMHFNEPIEVAFGAIRVYDTAGDRVDDGEVDYVEGDPTAVQVGLEPDLDTGTYTVTWRVISADAHVIQEAFVFHVGAPGTRPQGIADDVLGGQMGGDPLVGGLLGAMRILGYGSLIVLAGALVFMFFVWPQRADTPGGDPPHAEFVRRWSRALVVAWIVAVFATAASVILQGAHAAGLGLAESMQPALLRDVVTTRFGRVMTIRALVLLAGGVLWAVAHKRSADGSAAPSRGALLGMATLVIAAYAATAFAGHAGSTDPVAVNVPVDVLHLAAAGAWIGGLAILVFAAWPSFDLDAGHGSLRALSAVVKRYSDVAVIAVIAIVASGLWQSWVEVRAWRAFTGTTYGLTLITKLAVFIPLVALGGFNNRWAKPRIEKAAADDEPDHKPLQVLRRVVLVEVVLAMLVIGVTAFLVNLAPARVAAGVTGPFITDVEFGEGSLNVLVDPNQIGENSVHLTATTESGAPMEIKEMRVQFTMPAESIGPINGRGRKLAPGHFVVQGRQLSLPGRWTLEVIGRISRFDELRVRVPVTVNG